VVEIAAAAVRPVSVRRVLKSESVRAAALLFLLLAVVFYDVIFLGRSTITSNFMNPVDYRALPANYGPALVSHDEWLRRNLYLHANLRDPGATWWQWEPSTQFLKQAIAQREWPFWDPYVGGGAPAMANLTPAFFFPPYTLVVWLGASPTLLNAYFLLIVWQAAFFTFLFVRRHGVGFLTAMMAAAMVMLSGALHQQLGTFIGQTASCLPVTMYAMRVYLDRPDHIRGIAVTLVFAGTALASFPPLVLAIFGATAIYFLVGLLEQPYGTRIRVAAGGIASMFLAFGLVAFCYAPAFAARTAVPQLSIAYAHAGLDWMPALHLYQIVTPTLVGGAPIYADSTLRLPPGLYFPYVGMVVAVLACLAAPTTAKSRTLLVGHALAAGWIVLKLLGSPLVHWVGRLPVLDSIHFAYYFGTLLGFLLPCLAALGAERLLSGSVSLTRALAVALAAVAVVESLWHVGAAYDVFASRSAAYWIRDWRVLGVITVFAATALLVSVVLRDSVRPRRAAIVALLALAIAEGAYNGWYPNPAAWSIFDNPAPFLKALQAHAGANRVFSFAAPTANINEGFGIFSMDSLMTFNPPRAHGLYHRYAKPGLSIFQREATVIPPDPVLDRANIAVVSVFRAVPGIVNAARSRGYTPIFDDGFIALFERPTLPRFFFSSEYRRVDPAQALDAVASPNSREVVLEKDPGVPASPNTPHDPAVQVEAYRRNSVTVVVDAPRAGVLYAAENYFDGWTATRNGSPAEILPANYAFRAVAVPAGRSRIEFHYWPPGLTVGLWISAGSVLVLLGLAVIARR